MAGNIFQINQSKAEHHKNSDIRQGVRVSARTSHIVVLVRAAQVRGLVVPGLLNRIIAVLGNDPSLIDSLLDDGIKTPQNGVEFK